MDTTQHHLAEDDDANDFHRRETLPAPPDYPEDSVLARDEETLP